MALKMSRPKIEQARNAIKPAPQPARPEATPRQRGSGWVKRRAAWLSKHPMCHQCEQRGIIGIPAEEVDHVIPLWLGGRDDETNLQSMCKPCHAEKTAGEAAARAKAGIRGRWD